MAGIREGREIIKLQGSIILVFQLNQITNMAHKWIKQKKNAIHKILLTANNKRKFKIKLVFIIEIGPSACW